MKNKKRSRFPASQSRLRFLKRKHLKVAKKSILVTLNEKLEFVRKIITNATIIFLFIFVGFLIKLEFDKNPILVEPFEVSQNIEKMGYTGKVITSKLIDKINYIQKISPFESNTLEIKSAWFEQSEEFEIPGTGVSFKSIMRYIKEYFGSSHRRIVGEIAIEANVLKITTRIHGEQAVNLSIPFDTLAHLDFLDSLLLESAKHIFKKTEPYILASFYHKKNDKKACLEVIDYCLQNEPTKDDVWSYNLWGIVLHEEGHTSKATEKYELAIELYPKYAPPYINLGNILYEQKNVDQAIKMYEKAIVISDKYKNAYYNLGTVLGRQGDHDEAIKMFKKAVKLDPKFASAYLNWGVALRQQADTLGAIEKFKKAVKLKPKDLNAYNNWGYVLQGQGKYEAAIEKYKRAVEIDSSYAKTYYYWGNVYYDKNDFEEAIKKYNKATSLDPEYDSAYYKLGSSYFKLNDREAAVEQLNILKTLDQEKANKLSEIINKGVK